jgi:hypothetical protein
VLAGDITSSRTYVLDEENFAQPDAASGNTENVMLKGAA